MRLRGAGDQYDDEELGYGRKLNGNKVRKRPEVTVGES